METEVLALRDTAAIQESTIKELRRLLDKETGLTAILNSELAPDPLSHPTAHARIHFVEDHAQATVGAVGGGHLHGQTNTRQLATRGDLGHGPRRLPGVGGHQKLDFVEAICRRFSAATSADIDGELATGHAEDFHEVGDLLCQP